MRDRWFVDIAARVKSRVACQLPIVLVQAARAGCGNVPPGKLCDGSPHPKKRFSQEKIAHLKDNNLCSSACWNMCY